MPKITIEQVSAALPSIQTLSLPSDWFKGLPTNISVFESLYRWMTGTQGIDPERLHNRTYVGVGLTKRLRASERLRLKKLLNLNGEKLDRALDWSDLGSGPMGLFGIFKISGDVLFVIPEEQTYLAETVACKLSEDHRTRGNKSRAPQFSPEESR